MKTILLLSLLGTLIFGSTEKEIDIKELREVYSKPISKWPKPELDKEIKLQEMQSLETQRPEITNLVKLGIRFFNEPRFSSSMTLSCASCHAPNKAFTEHTRTSQGHNGLKGDRNSPTLYGVAEGMHFFWDGRAASLEEQALGPIENPVEMAMPLDILKDKIQTMSGYEKDLKEVFGDSKLTLDRIATAIAAYERTIIPPRTKFDEFLDGNVSALNDRELLGLHLFRTKARCMNCHSGKYLSDGDFHNLGLTYYKRKKYEDLGRYNVTKQNNSVGEFKTPTLRQIANTAPYMHNGLFPRLRGVLNAYNGGMFDVKAKTKEQKEDPLFPKKSKHLKQLNLTNKEIKALLMFLNTL